jgi:2-polyprenyl-3-methyl-5-hydroxy-6-metoxy-1,4-benzoquinol methylase
MTAAAGELQCPICGARDVARRSPFEAAQFWVIHCRACRHEAIRPLPSADEVRAFYSDYPTTQTASADVDFLVQRSLEFLRDFIARTELRDARLAELNFLELGFGNGASLFAAAKAGFRAHGIDLDASGVTRARSAAAQYGVRVECDATSIEAYRRDRPFHVVKASQIIEHTLDPGAFLSAISVRQPPGGYLIVECPNNDGAFWRVKNLLRRRYGRTNYFNSLKIGEHLSGFTRRSLALALDAAGYRIVRCHDYPMRHRWLQPENLLWYPSLREGISRTMRDGSAYHVQKALIALFDRAASACAGMGTHLAVWAQKHA